MKKRTVRRVATIQPKTANRLAVCTIAASLILACATSFAKPRKNNANHYQQVNLVSDQAGVAMLQDTNLVNAWGTSFSSSSPFWISDNGSGLATLYAVTNDSSGMVQVAKQGLEVTIPGE